MKLICEPVFLAARFYKPPNFLKVTRLCRFESSRVMDDKGRVVPGLDLFPNGMKALPEAWVNNTCLFSFSNRITNFWTNYGILPEHQ